MRQHDTYRIESRLALVGGRGIDYQLTPHRVQQESPSGFSGASCIEGDTKMTIEYTSPAGIRVHLQSRACVTIIKGTVKLSLDEAQVRALLEILPARLEWLQGKDVPAHGWTLDRIK
jgi:hypothetical protein